eukprot:6189254-Pleurochrysis_carterae.AAC.2
MHAYFFCTILICLLSGTLTSKYRSGVFPPLRVVGWIRRWDLSFRRRFSDLDVQPLRGFSALLPYLHEQYDFVIMQEPRPSASEEDVYNSGVWMLRVSPRTRALVALWISKYDSRLHSTQRGAFSDQTALYQLLEQVAALKRGWTRGIQPKSVNSVANLSQLAGLRVGTWPTEVVTGRVFPWLDEWRGPAGTPAHLPFPKNLQSLRRGVTVAYHAIALEWDPSIAPSQAMLAQHAQPRGRELKRDGGRFSTRTAGGWMTAQTASKIIAMYRVANYTRGVPVRMDWQPDREALRMHHFETRAKIASCCNSQLSWIQSDVCQQRTTSRIYRYSFKTSRFQLRR